MNTAFKFGRAKIIVLCAMLMAPFLAVKGQAQADGASGPLAYLEKTFPKLTNLYREELKKYPAHYIFAVDVSGTMVQYSEDVATSLRPFFQALPDGDRVDVIPFGTEALPGMVSYCGIIDPQVRTALVQNIGRLYSDPSYPNGFKGYTDIPKAVDAIASTIQKNREYKVNVIVVLTDFRNDIKGSSPSERKLTQDELSSLNEKLGAATHDSYIRSVALELPVDQSKPGYCLKQLKSDVFPQDGSGLEIVPMTNPGQMIGQWFEQLKREIMVTKLRAVIDIANKVNPVRLDIDTNIDGKTKAQIHWTPSKLYPMMKIDSTFVKQNGFVFNNKKENFQTTRDSVIGVDPELLLGQIKHDSYGFHHLQDSLHLGIDLPTEYDDELISLGVKKPLPATTQAIDKWIFTFCMPFWLTATLLILLILYIIGVIKAIARNNALCFKGNVTVYDAQGNQLGDMRRLPKQAASTVLTFGQGGGALTRVDDAAWAFVIEKKKGNPFLVFAKPYFTWRRTKGYVASGKAQSGKLSYDGPTSTRVKCGASRSEESHSIKVALTK